MTEVRSQALHRMLAGQLLNYVIVGLLSNAAGYVAYLLATQFGAEPKVTMTALYITGAAIGFWGNRRITFRHQGAGMTVGVRYIIAHCAGYLINLSLLYLLADRLHIAHQLAQAIGIVVVAVFLFVTFRTLVFRGAHCPGEDKP